MTDSRADENDATDDLASGDMLSDRDVDGQLDEGYSPPERPWVLDDESNMQAGTEGEAFERRLVREVPDVQLGDGDGLGDTVDTDGELRDDEVGAERAGRLQAVGGGSENDDELFAEDVGIDGAGASAEEAAVHVIPDR